MTTINAINNNLNNINNNKMEERTMKNMTREMSFNPAMNNLFERKNDAYSQMAAVENEAYITIVNLIKHPTAVNATWANDQVLANIKKLFYVATQTNKYGYRNFSNATTFFKKYYMSFKEVLDGKHPASWLLDGFEGAEQLKTIAESNIDYIGYYAGVNDYGYDTYLSFRKMVMNSVALTNHIKDNAEILGTILGNILLPGNWREFGAELPEDPEINYNSRLNKKEGDELVKYIKEHKDVFQQYLDERIPDYDKYEPGAYMSASTEEIEEREKRTRNLLNKDVWESTEEIDEFLMRTLFVPDAKGLAWRARYLLVADKIIFKAMSLINNKDMDEETCLAYLAKYNRAVFDQVIQSRMFREEFEESKDIINVLRDGYGKNNTPEADQILEDYHHFSETERDMFKEEFDKAMTYVENPEPTYRVMRSLKQHNAPGTKVCKKTTFSVKDFNRFAIKYKNMATFKEYTEDEMFEAAAQATLRDYKIKTFEQKYGDLRMSEITDDVHDKYDAYLTRSIKKKFGSYENYEFMIDARVDALVAFRKPSKIVNAVEDFETKLHETSYEDLEKMTKRSTHSEEEERAFMEACSDLCI